MLRPGSLAHRIQPLLEGLAGCYPVTALAMRLVSLDHIVVIATAGADRVMRLHVEPGSRFPALISATGRCVAAFGSFDPGEIAERFAKIHWENPPSFADWIRQVKETRRTGFSIDLGNYLTGITVVAVPIFDASGKLTHVIVTIGLREQVERAGVDAMVQTMLAAAKHHHRRGECNDPGITSQRNMQGE